MDHFKVSKPQILRPDFFDRDAQCVAQDLLGKVLQVKHSELWLMARIIETEAYCLDDKASHASLGYTEKRKALFMSPGTIYMYYARGGDSLNFSCQGDGNAVLIKSAYPVGSIDGDHGLATMISNNPGLNGKPRSANKLCAGQTLLCRSLGLKVPEWDGQLLNDLTFRVIDDSYQPDKIVSTSRLGINPERDAQLPYRKIRIV